VNWQNDAKAVLPLVYANAAHNTIAIGKQTANLIINLGLDASSDVHCIGHSLGAHVCGFCGKQKVLYRITGLKF
jgi:hypothetical protein